MQASVRLCEYDEFKGFESEDMKHSDSILFVSCKEVNRWWS